MAQKNEVLLIGPRILKVGKFPSAGLGYIGSYLSARGHKTRVIDTNFTGECPYTALKKADSLRLVGISCESRNIEEALGIARYAKDTGNTVIMGGLHVSLIKEKILENSFVDYAIHGDGELSLFEFIRFMEGVTSVSKVSGLIYRRGKKIIVNAKAGIENLDELSFPEYKLSGIRKIFDYPLITSRDCPYRCNFCTAGAISHGKWRYRSPENIIAELKLAKEKYKIERFTVLDENFSYDIERVKLFCMRLLKENFILPWHIFEGIRADRVDKELLYLLRMTGCRHLMYGIENADENIFKGISKGVELSAIENAIKLAKKQGVGVGGYFVVGLPGSTFESEMKTMQFVRNYKLYPAVFSMAIPYYNTELYKWVLKNAVLLREPIGDNLINSKGTEPFFETAIFPKDQVKKAFVMALSSFQGRK